MPTQLKTRNLNIEGTPAKSKAESEHFTPLEAAAKLCVPIGVIRAFMKNGKLKKAFPDSNSDLIDGDGVRAMLKHGVIDTGFKGCSFMED